MPKYSIIARASRSSAFQDEYPLEVVAQAHYEPDEPRNPHFDWLGLSQPVKCRDRRSALIYGNGLSLGISLMGGMFLGDHNVQFSESCDDVCPVEEELVG